MKMSISVFIDISGYWLARCVCHSISLIGLVTILFINLERSFLVYLGFPLYYGANTGTMLIHIFLACMFPVHQGKYMSLFKILYVIEPFIYNEFKQLDAFGQKMFWTVLLCLQPLLWLRTFTQTPKRNVDPDNIRLGWQTRFDEKPAANPASESNSEKTSYVKNFITYCIEIKDSMSINNILITIWVNLEILTGLSFYSQYYSYLVWKLNTVTTDLGNGTILTNDQTFVHTGKYVTYFNYNSIILLISLPIIGTGIDSLAKYIKTQWNLENILKGQVFSTIILMLVISLNSFLVHLVLSVSTMNPETKDFTYPLIPIISSCCMMVWLGHIWTVRNIYVVSANNYSFSKQSKVLFVNNFLQAVVHILSAMLPLIVEKLNGDWDKFYQYLCLVSVVNFIIPIWLYNYHFKGQRKTQSLEQDSESSSGADKSKYLPARQEDFQTNLKTEVESDEHTKLTGSTELSSSDSPPYGNQ